MILTEGDLEIDVPHALSGGKFDSASHGLSHCMKAVDFVVELADRYLFVEVKDPQQQQATAQGRNKFIAKMRSGQLDQDLMYKYRDSRLYEWAAGRAGKPIEYRGLIALNTLSAADLLTRTESLARNLPQRGPNNQPWRREVVHACGVFNLASWNRQFPGHPASRRP